MATQRERQEHEQAILRAAMELSGGHLQAMVPYHDLVALSALPEEQASFAIDELEERGLLAPIGAASYSITRSAIRQLESGATSTEHATPVAPAAIHNNFFGAVGNVAQNSSGFIQHAEQPVAFADPAAVLRDLSVLLRHMKEEAVEPHQYRAIADIADAETAAVSGDAQRAVRLIRGAGQWAQDVAVKFAAELSVAGLKAVFGMSPS